MKTSLLILCFAAGTLHAQTVLSLQSGMNSRTGFFLQENEWPRADSWKNGNSVSMGMDYFLKRSIALSGNFEADFYPFDTFRYFIIADQGFSPLWGSSGDACQIYRVSLEAKLFFSQNNARSVYLVTGISYITEHIGEIRFTNGSIVESTIDEQTYNYWAHSFGLGGRYLIWDEFGFDVTGKWYSDYSTHWSASLNFGVAYVL